MWLGRRSLVACVDDDEDGLGEMSASCGRIAGRVMDRLSLSLFGSCEKPGVFR